MERAKHDDATVPLAELSPFQEAFAATTRNDQPVSGGFVLDELGISLFTPADGIARADMAALATTWTGDTYATLNVVPTAKDAPSARASLEWRKPRLNIALTGERNTVFHRMNANTAIEHLTETQLDARLAYPISRARRVEFSVGGTRAPLWYRFRVGDEVGSAVDETVAASVALVHDDVSESSRLGPVSGARYRVELTRTLGRDGLSAQTLRLDARRYVRLGSRTIFAARLMYGVSGGNTPEAFHLGGHTSLRASEYDAVQGSRIGFMSMELRVPLINEARIAWPLAFGFDSLRGVAFIDSGIAWDKGDKPRLSRVTDDGRQFEDLLFQFGFGARMTVVGLQLRWDIARAYNLTRSSEWRSLARIDHDF